MYRRLDIKGISKTARRLHIRISERFPDSGLSKVAAELCDLTETAETRAKAISEPLTWLRTVIVGISLGLILVAAITLFRYPPQLRPLEPTQFIQLLNATMNVAVLLGGGALGLVTIENKVQRGRALKAAHELRALAHVIDMHQLTKDPDRVMDGGDTEHSPNIRLTPYELTRYLNYCSEMLSLIGKLGAYYVQDFDDPVALEAVNELEDLTTGLSQKIWQKIMIVHGDEGRRSNRISQS